MKKYRVPKNAITERGLRKLMDKAAKDHSSLSDWATAHSITPQAVSAFTRKVQTAGLQIPTALGYKPQIVYIPIKDDDISTANPPRRPTNKPTSKVDHKREAVEKKHVKAKDDREEAKRLLKARNKANKKNKKSKK